jgi:PiT family inorganic phosphate transporter
MNLVLFFSQGASPQINNVYKRLQILTLLSLALSYGANDSQKTMGLITLALVASGQLQSFHVPLWVIFCSAGAISLGTAFGGWRLIRTLGGRIYKIRPVHAFTAQAASAGVIFGAALVGGPVSTTHVISSAIMGAGAAERLNMVRWNLAQDMVFTWALTIPLTACVSALIYFLLIEIQNPQLLRLVTRLIL